MYPIILQRLIIEFIFDFFYFPLWWYTGGVAHMLRFCMDLLSAGNSLLAPGLWFKNIFVPMFGQHDWQGRLISFIVRLANGIARSLVLFIWFFVVLILFLLWVIMPLFVGFMFMVSIRSV